jgi:lipopolysaccharide/colanic/teichoic acid biosynthesis glycosyltransferase
MEIQHSSSSMPSRNRSGSMTPGHLGAGSRALVLDVLPMPIAKRVFDAALSAVGLLLSAPVWVALAAAIRLEDGGAVFYSQDRAGEGGRVFKAWKFRSMVPDAERYVGALQAVEHDPRITRVGQVMRKTAMDELPQLWNIFIGDMSFVGPRALRPGEIEALGDGRLEALEDVPGYGVRSRVRPGLTGVAQIYAPRDITRRNKFRYDRIYIRRRTFWLDIRLIVLSFWITFRGRWEVRARKL